MNMNKWRVIRDIPRPAGLNLSIDEMLLKQVNDSESEYVLKFNYFSPSAVILGLNQDLKDLNLEFINKKKFHLNRRLTGGAAILIGYPNEFSQMGISFITPINAKIPSKLSDKFKLFSAILMNSLKDIGLNPIYNKNSDILVNGRKVVGNGIYMMNNALLFHSVVLLEFDFSTTMQILKQEIEIKNEKNYPTSLTKESKNQISIQMFEDIIVNQAKNKWNMDEIEGLLLHDEIKASERINKKKYNTKNWIFQKSENLIDYGSCFVPNND